MDKIFNELAKKVDLIVSSDWEYFGGTCEVILKFRELADGVENDYYNNRLTIDELNICLDFIYDTMNCIVNTLLSWRD